MNRKQRRATSQAAPAVSHVPTTGVRFRCSGVDDAGCPDRACFVLAVGMRARDGLSLAALEAAARSAGWALGAGESKVPTGGTYRWLDPLCPACAGALASRTPAPVAAPTVLYSLEAPTEETP